MSCCGGGCCGGCCGGGYGGGYGGGHGGAGGGGGSFVGYTLGRDIHVTPGECYMITPGPYLRDCCGVSVCCHCVCVPDCCPCGSGGYGGYGGYGGGCGGGGLEVDIIGESRNITMPATYLCSRVHCAESCCTCCEPCCCTC